MLDFIPVGDLGKNRDKFLAKVNRTVGKGNWFWAFSLNKKLYSYDWGMQFYEDAFYDFFRKNVNSLSELCLNYSDVYVVNRFDIDANLDYKKQIQHCDHYDDIAIRRCLIRFGVRFKGKDILNLNNTQYSQEVIPFHLPHFLKTSDKSVGSWLKSSRFIVVANTIEDQSKLSEMLIK